MAGNVTQTIFAIGAGASAMIAPAAIGRNYLLVQVIGTGRVNLGFDAAPAANAGLALQAATVEGEQGGAVVWDGRAVPQNAVYALAAAATKVVVVAEG